MRYIFLIVERNQLMIDKTEAVINSLGMDCRVLLAKSFDVAREIMKVVTVDIFIVDMLLKDDLETGYDFVRDIQVDFPYSPIIVVSGNLDLEQQLKIFNELTVFAYINKPFQNFEIVNPIKKALPFTTIINNRRVTFKRNNLTKTYRTSNIYCIKRLPNGQKKIAVTAHDEFRGELTTEEFPIKSSLNEVLEYFENGRDILRCHQTWIINPYYIHGFDVVQNEIILAQNIRIPVGESYKDAFAKFI